jgi:hypothetical protein
MQTATWFGVRHGRMLVRGHWPTDRKEDAMQILMTALTVTAGMVFSLAVAILVEELIFGKVLIPLFARRLVQVEAAQKR